MDFQRGTAPDQQDIIIATKLEPCHIPAVPEWGGVRDQWLRAVNDRQPETRVEQKQQHR